ncbi:MAG: S8 family serine peptidase [Saprospiraceae bacterium]|nr:S8 family serine peptidase [Saprospiraceae bacterium]
MRITISILGIFLFLSSPSFGQLYNEVQLKNLSELLENLKNKNQHRKNRVDRFLKEIPQYERMDIQTKLRKGYEFFDVVNGKAQFRKSFNEDAAIAMGVPSVRTGGDLGLNLTGDGLNIGIWDGGLIRTTHQEFEGRIKYFDSAATTVFSDHATGVAGTLLGTGINMASRGMAPEATGIAYNFNNDEEEMVEAQMLKEIVVSNHSYGLITGWNDGQWYGDSAISDEEDWRFGFYDSQAKTWDDIAFNAPYYLIVKSAGNDRGDAGSGPYPSDGPYDCVSSSSTSKNIMVVGAVQKSNNGYDNPQNILMSSFSGWGPTDDGRIKPDIVGVGVDVRTSASASNDAYQVTSGTSFSSPAVCGGLALIQELHKEKYNEFMKASALKALAIHTATQTGEKGPDYRYGWGLLNVRDASNFILNEDGVNNQIVEDRLMNGQEWSIEINPLAGTQARFTLVWTDPSGNPVASSLDPEDLMLVNDLDIRLTDEAGNSHMPYILDPSIPQLGATTGDNFRDNVEQIYVDEIEDRKFFLTISHKGSLVNGAQDFSLIVEYQSSTSQLTSLYWIGSEGDWENGQNWSFSSGGSIANLAPNENNRVIIDDNSFPQGGSHLTLNMDSEVGSISSFVSKPYTLDLNRHTLTSGGNIKLNSINTSISNGKLNCLSTSKSASFSINLDSANTDGLVLEIPEGNSSSWTISNSYVNLDVLNFVSGMLDISNSDLSLNEFRTGPSDDNAESHLVVHDSELRLAGDFDLSGCTTFQENGTNVSFNGEADFNIAGYEFSENVTINASTVNILSSGASISQLESTDAILGISGTLNLGSLLLAGNSSLSIDQSSSASINESLLIEGDVQQPLTNLSGNTDGSSSLNIEFHEKLCFDNLNIQNLGLTGSASVSIGPNSTIMNSPGWSQLACDKLLFSDFDSRFTCVSAQTEFLDISEGEPNSWEWYVNGNLRSTMQNFYTSFQSTGSVDIELKVGDAEGNVSRYNRSVEITETPLDSNTVIISTDVILASQRPAEAYQWYRNKKELEGETSRTYFYNGEIADYYVITFEGDCNRKSKDLRLLTSTNEEEFTSGIEIFPNPATDIIRISTKNLKEVKDIKILTPNGIELKTKEEQVDKNQYKLNLSDLDSGVYIIYMITEDRNFPVKFIKM